MVVYQCVCEFNGHRLLVLGERLSEFSEGFWINPEYQLTKGGDAWYWIPPGRVLYVEKLDWERA